MKKLALIVFVFWVCILASGFFYFNYASMQTEEKYLRNISKYRLLNKNQFYISSDTLTFMARCAFSSIDPFHQWYIADVGAIRPWSALSKKLDSIATTYIPPANKYK